MTAAALSPAISLSAMSTRPPGRAAELRARVRRVPRGPTSRLRVLDQTLGALANTNSRFDAALNNMSQGLHQFDFGTRIAVVNRKYIEMYGLSTKVVRPGLQSSDLIRHRKETGSFDGDVEQYCADIDAALAQGKATA